MISLATETERTLFFDFLPLDLGTVRGFKTRIHLYTVPGQVFYDASRKLILRGVDGIVFVADSQEQRMDANVEALDNLMSNLKERLRLQQDSLRPPAQQTRPPRHSAGGSPEQRAAQEERSRGRSRSLPGNRRLRDPERNRQAGFDGTKSRRLTNQTLKGRSDSAGVANGCSGAIILYIISAVNMQDPSSSAPTPGAPCLASFARHGNNASRPPNPIPFVIPTRERSETGGICCRSSSYLRSPG